MRKRGTGSAFGSRSLDLEPASGNADEDRRAPSADALRV